MYHTTPPQRPSVRENALPVVRSFRCAMRSSPFCTALENNTTERGRKLSKRARVIERFTFVAAERKSRFCNLLWGGYFPTAPLRAAKRRVKTLVSVRSDHLNRIGFQVRKPAPRPALRGAMVRNGVVYDHVPLSCAKIERESDERKRNLFGRPVCVRSTFSLCLTR